MKELEKEIMDQILHRALSEIFETEKDDFMNYSRESKEKKYITTRLLQEENHKYKQTQEQRNFF